MTTLYARLIIVLLQTTGLTGLHVSEAPHMELKRLYARILRTVEQMPETSTYRKATEQLVKHRKQIVESTEKITDVEEKIGMGQAEELIWQVRPVLLWHSSFHAIDELAGTQRVGMRTHHAALSRVGDADREGA